MDMFGPEAPADLARPWILSALRNGKLNGEEISGVGILASMPASFSLNEDSQQQPCGSSSLCSGPFTSTQIFDEDLRSQKFSIATDSQVSLKAYFNEQQFKSIFATALQDDFTLSGCDNLIFSLEKAQLFVRSLPLAERTEFTKKHRDLEVVLVASKFTILCSSKEDKQINQKICKGLKLKVYEIPDILPCMVESHKKEKKEKVDAILANYSGLSALVQLMDAKIMDTDGSSLINQGHSGQLEISSQLICDDGRSNSANGKAKHDLIFPEIGFEAADRRLYRPGETRNWIRPVRIQTNTRLTGAGGPGPHLVPFAEVVERLRERAKCRPKGPPQAVLQHFQENLKGTQRQWNERGEEIKLADGCETEIQKISDVATVADHEERVDSTLNPGVPESNVEENISNRNLLSNENPVIDQRHCGAKQRTIQKLDQQQSVSSSTVIPAKTGLILKQKSKSLAGFVPVSSEAARLSCNLQNGKVDCDTTDELLVMDYQSILPESVKDNAMKKQTKSVRVQTNQLLTGWSESNSFQLAVDRVRRKVSSRPEKPSLAVLQHFQDDFLCGEKRWRLKSETNWPKIAEKAKADEKVIVVDIDDEEPSCSTDTQERKRKGKNETFETAGSSSTNVSTTTKRKRSGPSLAINLQSWQSVIPSLFEPFNNVRTRSFSVGKPEDHCPATKKSKLVKCRSLVNKAFGLLKTCNDANRNDVSSHQVEEDCESDLAEDVEKVVESLQESVSNLEALALVQSKVDKTASKEQKKSFLARENDQLLFGKLIQFRVTCIQKEKCKELVFN